MLHRHDDIGLVVISQPAHAWVSGQLAASWGNDDIGLAPPGPQLRIAAEQHDIAWLEWEANPTLNPETGLPYAFNEMPTLEHLSIWNNATARALAYGRLPALLISMHGTYLYERFHDFDSDTSEEVAAAKGFLERETGLQEQMLEEARRVSDISQAEVTQQRRLVSTWDALSLGLCMGIEDSREFSGIPGSDGDIAMTFRRLSSSEEYFAVDPWPFVGDQVDLFCEGRRLNGPFQSDEELRAAVAAAQSVYMRFTLVRSM